MGYEEVVRVFRNWPAAAVIVNHPYVHRNQPDCKAQEERWCHPDPQQLQSALNLVPAQAGHPVVRRAGLSAFAIVKPGFPFSKAT